MAELMALVGMIVQTISGARPSRSDCVVPLGHDIDNCSLKCCRKDTQLDHGESRSPTQILQQNLLPP